MAEISRFWNGTSVGDAGPYSDDNMAEVLRYITGANGSKADAGVLYGSGVSPDPGLRVTPTSPASADVKLSPGAALIHGTFYKNDAVKTFTIAANASGLTRIDTVVLTKDWATQTVRSEVLQGTPAASPVPVALTQTDGVEWQIPLADITVASGFTTIGILSIFTRAFYLPGADSIIVTDVLNNSGGTLHQGMVVIWDSSQDRAVTTTTVIAHPDVAGVWMDRTAAGARGRVLSRGIGYVHTTIATPRGSPLYTASSQGYTQLNYPVAYNNDASGLTFGYALETSIGGTTLAYINAPFPIYRPAFRNWQAQGSFSTASGTMVDIDASAVLTSVIRSQQVKFSLWVAMTTAGGATSGSFAVYNDQVGYFTLPTDELFVLTTGQTMLYKGVFIGLTPGSQTFRARFRNQNAPTGTVVVNRFNFTIEEIPK